MTSLEEAYSPVFDGLPHLGDHLRRQRDGYLFDGWHGGPPCGGMTSYYHSNIRQGNCEPGLAGCSARRFSLEGAS
jgi:hypothetical protein